jgi:uncharacterized protein (DUF2141 family)
MILTMKKIILLSFLMSSQLFAETVQLKFSNMGNLRGRMAIAVFDNPDSFPDRSSSAVLTKFFPITVVGNSMTATIDLKPGRYAIAAYLDANSNGVLDKNLVGIPKERFGFSNNPSVQFSAPNFNECEVEVKAKAVNVQQINLLKFL